MPCISPVIKKRNWAGNSIAVLHTNAQHSSSTTRFYLPPVRPRAPLPAFGGAAAPAAARHRPRRQPALPLPAAGAGGNGGSLRRSLTGLGADTATKFEVSSSWRQHRARSTSTAGYAGLGIISFVAFVEGSVKKIFKLHWTTSPSRIDHNLDVRTIGTSLQRFRQTGSSDD